MRKLIKNKAGFSLIEMVLVIAIIVILAAVFAMSITAYLNTANNKSNEASRERSVAVSNMRECESRMVSLRFAPSDANINVVRPTSSVEAS